MKKLAILAFAMVVCAAISPTPPMPKKTGLNIAPSATAKMARARPPWQKARRQRLHRCQGPGKNEGRGNGQGTKEGVKDADGKIKMKAFGDVLTDDEIKALVKHVRALKK